MRALAFALSFFAMLSVACPSPPDAAEGEGEGANNLDAPCTSESDCPGLKCLSFCDQTGVISKHCEDLPGPGDVCSEACGGDSYSNLCGSGTCSLTPCDGLDTTTCCG
ncbi:MAG TPA: hypothetical protein VGO62_10335 [Myxococcota bacterium]